MWLANGALQWGTVGEWAAAIGTMFAGLAAIGIAIWSERKANRERRRQAYERAYISGANRWTMYGEALHTSFISARFDLRRSVDELLPLFFATGDQLYAQVVELRRALRGLEPDFTSGIELPDTPQADVSAQLDAVMATHFAPQIASIVEMIEQIEGELLAGQGSLIISVRPGHHATAPTGRRTPLTKRLPRISRPARS